MNQVARFGGLQGQAKCVGLAVAVRVVVAEFHRHALHVAPGGWKFLAHFVEPALAHTKPHLHALHRQDDHLRAMGGNTQVVIRQKGFVGHLRQHRFEVHQLVGLVRNPDHTLVIVEQQVGCGVGVERRNRAAEPLVGRVTDRFHGDTRAGFGKLGAQSLKPFDTVVAHVVPDHEFLRAGVAKHQCGSRSHHWFEHFLQVHMCLQWMDARLVRRVGVQYWCAKWENVYPKL